VGAKEDEHGPGNAPEREIRKKPKTCNGYVVAAAIFPRRLGWSGFGAIPLFPLILGLLAGGAAGPRFPPFLPLVVFVPAAIRSFQGRPGPGTNVRSR